MCLSLVVRESYKHTGNYIKLYTSASLEVTKVVIAVKGLTSTRVTPSKYMKSNVVSWLLEFHIASDSPDRLRAGHPSAKLKIEEMVL